MLAYLFDCGGLLNASNIQGVRTRERIRGWKISIDRLLLFQRSPRKVHHLTGRNLQNRHQRLFMLEKLEAIYLDHKRLRCSSLPTLLSNHLCRRRLAADTHREYGTQWLLWRIIHLLEGRRYRLSVQIWHQRWRLSRGRKIDETSAHVDRLCRSGRERPRHDLWAQAQQAYYKSDSLQTRQCFAPLKE